ncbi:ankyrin repeat domain-containing protein [Endozoicomonas sp. GU-1]|uniref:ankyrin repeat domain-containing protein n=1 Tax=Endozoicomonas sp. GU-1 TaxID=3009078 RepID=UPI0022B595E9|nr:ankyrin repeat domain-containing protein [Endozoicomonas sp. GU-1]WBA81586.1 ankyrin repeat domain-containing protein [Endozoicomonas sp. GU-1]WBA84539.1 ankyrin repeat domain-containing protein [Endozoicomonas sp. GU-1]
MIDSAGHLYSLKITIDGDFKMQVTNTDQPLKYEKPSGADLNKQTKSEPRFADSSVATTKISPKTETEIYAPTSPTTSIAGVSCKVINPDGAASITVRNASESLKRPFSKDSGYESTLCKLMKSDLITPSADRTSPDIFIKTLLTAITDTDTSNAKRLLSEHGATELSGYRCSFSFEGTTYLDITPFALACRLGKLDLVKELYAKPEQLNQKFDTTNEGIGQTPLMLAALSGNFELIRQLLKWGAELQTLDKDGNVVDVIGKVLNLGDIREKTRNLIIEHYIENDLISREDSPIRIGYNEFTDDDGIGGTNDEYVYLNPDYNKRQQVDEGSHKLGLLDRLFSKKPQPGSNGY